MSVLEGKAARLQVIAYSFDLPTYQWRKGHVEIPSATRPDLSLDTLSQSSRDLYDVVISNLSGSVTSQVARVDVRVLGTELPGPRLDSMGRASLTVPAETALQFRFQISSDLEHWSDVPAWIRPALDGLVDVIDIDATQASRRFYRLVRFTDSP